MTQQSMKMLATTLLSTLLLMLAANTRAQDAPIMALDPTLMAGWSGNIASTNNSWHPTAPVKKNFSYTSTHALRQRVVASFASRLQNQNSQGAQTLRAAFGPGKTDYEDVYQQLLKTSALHNNDAADALAGVILTGYQIVNAIQDKQVTPAMERGARAQVAAILAKNPKINTAAARAQISEEFKLQTVLLALGWQETVKNNTQATYRKSIASMFQNQYHMDLLKLKLTVQGFVKK